MIVFFFFSDLRLPELKQITYFKGENDLLPNFELSTLRLTFPSSLTVELICFMWYGI